MVKINRAILAVIIFSLFFSSGLLFAQDSSKEFVVIVNKSNSVKSLSKSQVSRMFLKKVFTWKDGEPVKPIDLVPGSKVRQAFSQDIHGRNVYSIKNYWQQMIFAGRDAPPLEKNTDAEIIDYVKSNPNAIGYVSSKAPLDDVNAISISY